MSDDDSVKKILSYQESCDAGESVRSISGWFQKAKKAKRRVWPGQTKFERRYLTLAGYQLYYSSNDKGTGGGKPPVDMNSFLWVNIPSNNPRCVDQYGNPTGFDLVSQARILSLVPEEEKGAQDVAKILMNWKSKVQAGFLIKINKRGKLQKRWFMLYGYDLHYYEDPDDLKTKKDPVDLRDVVEICRPSRNPHAEKYSKFEIVDGKRVSSTCLDLVFADREYTLVAIPDDRASIEIFNTIGKWKGKDSMVLVKGLPILTSDHEVTKAGADGFGIIVTVIPPMINSPKGWYGHNNHHLRVTVLPQGKVSPENPAQKAGIRLGDALVAVNGQGNISTVEKLAVLVRGRDKVTFTIVRLPFKMNVEDARWKEWCDAQEARRKAEEKEEMERLAREKLKQQLQDDALRELEGSPGRRRRRKQRTKRQKSAFGEQMGDDVAAALEDVDIEALKLEAAAAAAGSTPEPPSDDAPALPAAASAAIATDSEDEEWDVSIVDDNGAGSYMI